MKTSTSILTIMVAVALAGCQITVDDDRVSGSLGSGNDSQTTEDKARPTTNPGAGNSPDNSAHNRPNDEVVPEPEPTEPEPTEPEPTEPEPTEPEPTEPEPTEPEPTEPEPTEPEPTEPETRSVTLYWSAPLERVNGETLNVTDIAGYEIRYRQVGATEYTRVVVNGHEVNNYYIDDLSSADYVFELAVFDTSGLYSDYVVAQ